MTSFWTERRDELIAAATQLTFYIFVTNLERSQITLTS